MAIDRKKIMVLGASGMLGSALCKYFVGCNEFEIQGVARNLNSIEKLNLASHFNPIICNDLTNFELAEKIIVDQKPDIIINCVGLIKQITDSKSYQLYLIERHAPS